MDQGQKLRIGILISDTDNLRNDQFNLIQHVVSHPSLELCVLIGKSSGGKGKFAYLYNNWSNEKGNTLLKRLFFFHLKWESKLFKQWKTVDPGKIIKEISGVERITISPDEGDPDKNNHAFDRIKEIGLDLIIASDNIFCPPELSALVQKGIWQLWFGENLKDGSGPSGFSEIVTRESFCTVLLIQQSGGKASPMLIDKAYYNRDWFFMKSFFDTRYAALGLLFKNIERVIANPDVTGSPIAAAQNSVIPGMKYLFRYMRSYYSRLAFIAISRPLYKIFHIKRECWALFLGEGDFFKADIRRSAPQPMPKNEFWADPFLISRDGKSYVFFENYSYETKIAKISAGSIENNRIKDVRDVLVKNYHLSYPHLVEEDGVLYLIPETGGSMRLEVYKCVEFPYSWELYSTHFEGEYIGDTTYFQDEKGDRWLFLNKGKSINSELYIYKIDNLRMERVVPHAMNPVYIDCRKARNAGSVFKYEEEYYRPNQRNIDGIYGRELGINKIKVLTLTEYEEELIRVIKPDFKKGLQAIHTFNQIPGLFVVDGCYTFK
ncbi:MAG: hypothetical protein EPN37_17385 [Chitinophagaceae bacterium]|nr:MAG: hypothetical protein EPN37_17385 [Chitinophagaceae bacterium]